MHHPSLYHVIPEICKEKCGIGHMIMEREVGRQVNEPQKLKYRAKQCFQSSRLQCEEYADTQKTERPLEYGNNF
jgi:hypothetical protein